MDEIKYIHSFILKRVGLMKPGNWTQAGVQAQYSPLRVIGRKPWLTKTWINVMLAMCLLSLFMG